VFSGRRRQTRSKREWSSDVCSSDLAPILRYAEVLLNYAEALNEVGRSADAMIQVNKIRERAGLDSKPLNLSKDEVWESIFHEARSEERRVGKECRTGWGGDHARRIA